MKSFSTSPEEWSIHSQCSFIKQWNLIQIMSIVGIIALLFADSTSLFSYGYALALLAISSYFVCRDDVKDLFFAYHFYFLWAIAIFVLFRYQDPLREGLTSSLLPLDDGRFYSQLVDGRVRYFITASLDYKMPYTVFLMYLYPFGINTPLNIITVNVIFAAFLPIFVRRLSYLITKDNKVGYYSFLYSLLCPFTLFFGCVLLRESFTAVMVIAGLCYFIQKKYLSLAICVILLIWIRFGTLVFLVVGIILLYRFQLKRRKRTDFYFTVLLIALIVAFYISYSFIQEFSGGRLGDSVIRTTSGERYENSTLGAIMNLPFPINVIISTVFFLFIPLFSIPKLDHGHFVLNNFFVGTLTPFFMFFLWNYLFNAALVGLNRKDKVKVTQILYMVLLFALLLGTISMQSRHKTILFPILCILAAYGKVHYVRKYAGNSLLLAAIVIVPMLFVAFVNLIR